MLGTVFTLGMNSPWTMTFDTASTSDLDAMTPDVTPLVYAVSQAYLARYEDEITSFDVL